MGDAEPDVQKALSWAYRSLMGVDRPATEAALRAETERAAATDDGHRAWVIRDTLTKLDPATADEFRDATRGDPQAPGRTGHLGRIRDRRPLRSPARSRLPSGAPALMPIPTQPAHADATGETST